MYKRQEHGLIVSLTDLGDSVAIWGSSAIDIPNSESAWNGQANTAAIILAGGLLSEAAGVCDTSTSGGQTDWYLPSIQELEMIYDNLHVINKVLTTVGSLAELIYSNEPVRSYYWSSTEYSHDWALTLDFWSHSVDVTSKYGTQWALFGGERVRGIRAF